MAKAAQNKIGPNRGNAGKGRPKGARNKATAEIKAIAQPYTPEAIASLVDIMRNSESDAARVSAIKEVLDRAWGKAAQAVTHSDPDGGPIRHAFDLTDEALAKIATGRA